MPTAPTIRAPRGTELSCKGWQQEAALRMLMNNLDPEVAERPQDLVVYGGAGKAARDWEAFDAIVATLSTLERRRDAARAVGQAGRRVPDPPLGAARADRQRQPRRRLGQLGRVPPARRAGPHHVRPDDGRLVDLHRHPGHPAGHLRDLRRGRAQALRRRPRRRARADRRPGRHGRRAAAGRHDGGRARSWRRSRRRRASSAASSTAISTSRPSPRRGAALGRGAHARRGRSRSACSATPPTSTRARAARRHSRPVTDQTSAHDPLNGYVPNGMSSTTRSRCARATPPSTPRAAQPRWPSTCEAMVALQKAGAPRLRLRQQHARRGPGGGYTDAFDFPGFVPPYIRPLFCEGNGPFRWVALSGDPADIAVTDRAVLEPFPDNEMLTAGSAGRRAGRVPGTPRSHLLARAMASAKRLACASTSSSAPARSRRPSSSAATTSTAASVASPNRETEAMRDGSDAIADWPILNALVNAANGASWVASTTAVAWASATPCTPAR